jgi:hypothetical protein
MESDPKTALKQLTIAEIQRPGRLPSQEVGRLLLVLEICWLGAWPLFNVEELSTLLQRPHLHENSLRFSVVTKVVLDSNSINVARDLVASCERFLRIPGHLQNTILLAGAQITNIPEMKIEYLTIDRPRVQAANLAGRKRPGGSGDRVPRALIPEIQQLGGEETGGKLPSRRLRTSESLLDSKFFRGAPLTKRLLS